MVLKIRDEQFVQMGRRWIQRNIEKFREILIGSRTLKPDEDRDEELEAYVLAAWDRGLRRPNDLCTYAVACFQAGGDVGQVPSLAQLIEGHLDAKEGVMRRLTMALPIMYWASLGKKLPAAARWQGTP